VHIILGAVGKQANRGLDVNEAVKKLRASLGLSQQRFATELGLSIRAIVNYEQNRVPSARALAQMESLAGRTQLPELAYDFGRALAGRLGLGRGTRGPLDAEENYLRRAFDRCVLEHPKSRAAKTIRALLKRYAEELRKEDSQAIRVLESSNAGRP
jgi:transcriptional regulator with XRE-family HTH domain